MAWNHLQHLMMVIRNAVALTPAWPGRGVDINFYRKLSSVIGGLETITPSHWLHQNWGVSSMRRAMLKYHRTVFLWDKVDNIGKRRVLGASLLHAGRVGYHQLMGYQSLVWPTALVLIKTAFQHSFFSRTLSNSDICDTCDKRGQFIAESPPYSF